LRPFDFWAELFYTYNMLKFLYVKWRILNNERTAVDNYGVCSLVFASGLYFAEIWHKDLNGSQPPGGG
jgi:hypothetical protein